MSREMINGTLTVNLDPPYLCFQVADEGRSGSCLRECSTEEIRRMLIALGAHRSGHWPVSECIIRSKGQFSIKLLRDFKLVAPLLCRKLERRVVPVVFNLKSSDAVSSDTISSIALHTNS